MFLSEGTGSSILYYGGGNPHRLETPTGWIGIGGLRAAVALALTLKGNERFK